MRYIFFLLLFLPFATALGQNLNAGFVQGIWYSKTPFFAGETVRIYTAVQNNSGFDIQGTVEFLVNGNSVGKPALSVINGRIVEVWADWEVTQGNHSITVNIKEAFKVEIGKDPELISLDNTQLGESEVFADQDTDQDGIGNIEDTDDDNDLLSDEIEKELGTDPLSKDTDQDGISDATEVANGTNPLVAESAPKDVTGLISNALHEPATEEKIGFEDFAQQVTKDILPKIAKTVDGFVENAVKKFQDKREKLQESQKPLSTTEKSLDFLLAAAITSLPEWKIALFLFFAIAAALLLRRLRA